VGFRDKFPRAANPVVNYGNVDQFTDTGLSGWCEARRLMSSNREPQTSGAGNRRSELHKDLFEVFLSGPIQSATRSRGGTGMGLASSRSLSEMHRR